MSRKITRSDTNKIIGGVCAGIAEYAGWDPTAVRIGAIVLGIFGGSGILAYLLAWAIVPAPDGSSVAGDLRQSLDDRGPYRDDRDTFDPYRE